jgi:hypothetical protein
VSQETPARSALQPTEPLLAAVPSIVPPAETKIISRHWHDPNATAPSATKFKQPKQAVANKKSKTVDPKGSQAADRSKPT